MSYLRDLGATPDLTKTLTPESLLANWRSQPYTEKLKALANWHANATRYFNLAVAKAERNDRWTKKWRSTFGLGAAFLAFAVSLSKTTAAQAYQKGAAVGGWLASHQDAPEDIRNDLKNAKLFLDLIAKGSEEYGVDPNATPTQIQEVVRQMQNAPRGTTAVLMRQSARAVPWKTILLIVGGGLVLRKLFGR